MHTNVQLGLVTPPRHHLGEPPERQAQQTPCSGKGPSPALPWAVRPWGRAPLLVKPSASLILTVVLRNSSTEATARQRYHHRRGTTVLLNSAAIHNRFERTWQRSEQVHYGGGCEPRTHPSPESIAPIMMNVHHTNPPTRHLQPLIDRYEPSPFHHKEHLVGLVAASYRLLRADADRTYGSVSEALRQVRRELDELEANAQIWEAKLGHFEREHAPRLRRQVADARCDQREYVIRRELQGLFPEQTKKYWSERKNSAKHRRNAVPVALEFALGRHYASPAPDVDALFEGLRVGLASVRHAIRVYRLIASKFAYDSTVRSVVCPLVHARLERQFAREVRDIFGFGHLDVPMCAPQASALQAAHDGSAETDLRLGLYRIRRLLQEPPEDWTPRTHHSGERDLEFRDWLYTLACELEARRERLRRTQPMET